MGNKLLVAVVVIALVAILYFSTSGVSFFDDDGALPEGTVKISITDTTTGFTGTHTMPIEELAPGASLFGTPNVLTSYQQDVWGIVDDNLYDLSFDISASAIKPNDAPEGMALTGTVYMEGTTPNPPLTDYNNYVYIQNPSIPTFPNNITTTNSATWNTTIDYTGITFNAASPDSFITGTSIKGSCIDGSTFDITFIIRDVGTNGLVYFGVVTAELTINVDNDGNVAVTIDEVNAGISDS